MNNKGQVLILFLLLLPLVLIIFAYVVDKCYLLYQENSQTNIGVILCDYVTESNKTEENIKQLALENDKEIKKVKVIKNNKQTKIVLEKEIDSIFGNIIGIDTYKIKTETKCIE